MAPPIAPETARAAIETLWACLVELAEAGHERSVDAQAKPDAQDAAYLAHIAQDMEALAQAALRLTLGSL